MLIAPLAALLAMFSPSVAKEPTDFLTRQKQSARVRDALRDKGEALTRKLGERGLSPQALNVLFVAYKAEGVLELHAKRPDAARYERFAAYRICTSSGALGPKRKQGDRQVPEGFYRIDRFNPASRYHLSLGVSYPNAADRRKSHAADLGGDIFIHGDCVTIGCLPMTDDKIEEIYLYALYARASGQQEIPIYIFPFRMSAQNMDDYAAQFRRNPELVAFWRNLKQGYDRYTADGKALRVRVEANGDYTFGE
ncbi:MAG: L,D-transpeptidase family protein [Azoarcus sp.]|jgi:murein L,D-transpeptidase YafK|nr:L,D-transpeptidase family protein [Azoarcus sp.]